MILSESTAGRIKKRRLSGGQSYAVDSKDTVLFSFNKHALFLGLSADLQPSRKYFVRKPSTPTISPPLTLNSRANEVARPKIRSHSVHVIFRGRRTLDCITVRCRAMEQKPRFPMPSLSCPRPTAVSFSQTSIAMMDLQAGQSTSKLTNDLKKHREQPLHIVKTLDLRSSSYFDYSKYASLPTNDLDEPQMIGMGEAFPRVDYHTSIYEENDDEPVDGLRLVHVMKNFLYFLKKVASNVRRSTSNIHR